MTGLGKIAAVMALALSLGGCALPAADTIQLAPVPGVALPYKARVMVFASETDLARTMTIAVTRTQDEETKVREGFAQAKATRTMLAKGFETVEINDRSIRPQIVVKLVGKANWSKLDRRIKVGCALDVWTADGVPLGNFANRVDAGEADYRSELESAYALCLKKPMDELLRSPALARLAGTGFRDPPNPAVEAWMRTLGTIPAFK